MHGKATLFANLILSSVFLGEYSRILLGFLECNSSTLSTLPSAHSLKGPSDQGQFCAFGSPQLCPRTSGDSGYQDEWVVGGTLSLGYPIAVLTVTNPLTTSAGWVLRDTAPEGKALSIRSGCKTNESAYKYHTVNLRVCQHFFHTKSYCWQIRMRKISLTLLRTWYEIAVSPLNPRTVTPHFQPVQQACMRG